MPNCRVCAVKVPFKRRYCDSHRQAERLASKQDLRDRKNALKPRFVERGLRFDSNRSLRWLYRQLGESVPRRGKAMRVQIAQPPRRRGGFYRGARYCANPVCGNEFLPKRRNQVYCYGGDVDCRAQAARIRREVALGVKFGHDPETVRQSVILRLRLRYQGASFTHV